jgi:hypothetical protein
MTNVPNPPPGAAGSGPTWALVAGFGIGTLTLIFLMGLAGLGIAGYPIPCGNAFPIMLLFGLCLGLSSAFLGGYFAATGDIELPFLGGKPLNVAAGGGILFLLAGVGIAFLVVTNSCQPPIEKQSSLIRGKITSIPGDIEIRPDSDEFFYNNVIDRMGKKCEWAETKLPDGGTEKIPKCLPEKYDYVFAIDTRSSEHDATISFVKLGAEPAKRVCQIRLIAGDPLPRTGEIAADPIDDVVEYDREHYQVKFEMVYASSPRAAESQTLKCFQVSFPGSKLSREYPVRVTEEGAEAYQLGIRGRSVIFVQDAKAASAEKPMQGSMADFARGLRPAKTQLRLAQSGNGMPVLNMDPVADLENDDAVIRERARKILIQQFTQYKEDIWENLTDKASPTKLSALINILTSALRPEKFTYRNLSAELPDMPPDKLKLIVDLAITSESAAVRAEARRFMRTFPYDSVEGEFQRAFGALMTPSGSECSADNLEKCRQGAFAGNYLYYNRLANVMLRGSDGIAAQDFSFADAEFVKASKLRQFLTPSAQVDFISPLFALNQIVLWGEMQPAIVPDGFKERYSSAKLSDEIVSLASNSKDYYPYPHHIYSALAAKKNQASYFQDVLETTEYGSKVIDYPPGSTATIKPDTSVYSGPDAKHYSHTRTGQAMKAQVLSQFGDWYFYKLSADSSATADFGWVERGA